MKQQSFPLEDVLAVVFDRMLSASKNGIIDMCSFLVGTEISPGDLPAILHDYCRPEILKQHPELHAIDFSIVTEENYWTWMNEQKWKYGAVVTISRVI